MLPMEHTERPSCRKDWKKNQFRKALKSSSDTAKDSSDFFSLGTFLGTPQIVSQIKSR